MNLFHFHANSSITAKMRRYMELLKNLTFPKPTIFSCMRILQHIGRPHGISYYQTRFGFNLDTLFFTVSVIWQSLCYLGILNLCISHCNREIIDKRFVMIILGIRLMQLGLMICIIKFRFSNKQVLQMLQLSYRLSEKNVAGIISFRYHRRNFVIITLLLLFALSKIIQWKEKIESMIENANMSNLVADSCSFVTTWPLLILTWQFFVWMQLFSRALEASFDELRYDIISAQDWLPLNEMKIIESISRVKVVLQLKKKILCVFGLTVVYSQLCTCIWVILHVYWYTYAEMLLNPVLLGLRFTLNVMISFTPHWIGQEISLEVSYPQYKQ